MSEQQKKNSQKKITIDAIAKSLDVQKLQFLEHYLEKVESVIECETKSLHIVSNVVISQIV